MKRYIFGSFLFLLTTSFFLAACDTRTEDETAMDDTDQVMESQNNMTDTSKYFWTYDKDYTYAERDQFERDVKQAKAKLDQEIARLESKAESSTGETKEWYNEKAEDLKEERAELDNNWKEFENATEENWDDFKESVSGTWNDIEDSWNDIEIRMDADTEDM